MTASCPIRSPSPCWPPPTGLGDHERAHAPADRGAHIGLDRVSTCLLALMDPQAGTCTVSGAGHLLPLVIQPGGVPQMLWAPAGPPIGTELGDYESITVRIEPGDVLLLYTDGLVEQRGTDIDVSLQALADQSLRRTAHWRTCSTPFWTGWRTAFPRMTSRCSLSAGGRTDASTAVEHGLRADVPPITVPALHPPRTGESGRPESRARILLLLHTDPRFREGQPGSMAGRVAPVCPAAALTRRNPRERCTRPSGGVLLALAVVGVLGDLVAASSFVIPRRRRGLRRGASSGRCARW
ncbi:PP2C family protein-serine/threonine phosphatase [Streptomyces sp. NPDC051677]|uniref:PP2C family protein-serine/threonine phosphatase n=1 Tax=Streptomyces sp. NPDC051677 TaxID=3365669 RepID=UPI0037D4B875